MYKKIVYLICMEYINIKEAVKLTGKSERTIRGRISMLSKKDKARYIKRGNKNALLINNDWLVSLYKGKEYRGKDSEISQLLKEKEARISDLQRQLEEVNNHLTQTNARLGEANANLYKLQDKVLSIEAPKENNGNWFSRILNKKII